MKRLLRLLFIIGFFTASANAGYVTVLHNFGNPLGNTGIEPASSVIFGPDGTLYGTDSQGGNQNYGTIYYVLTNGYTLPLWNFSNTGDGAYPVSELVLSGNTLYGTTEGVGGSIGYGTIFKINTDGTGFTTLYTFTAGNDGAAPRSGLILSGNVLYGTASGGGASGEGTIFKINTDGTGFKVLYSFTALDQVAFTNTDGTSPQGTLLLNGSTLYGTASSGGNNDAGTIFAIQTNGNGFTNLHSFVINEGYQPEAGLILTGGKLFGTTFEGGTASGIIFSINPDGTDFTNLYSLNADGNDGMNPSCRLAVIGSTLFGTAERGGANGNGTVFSINTDGSDFKVIHSFEALDPDNDYNFDGANPAAGLLVYNGELYGTASSGGPVPFGFYGTVFELDPAGLNFNLYDAFDAVSAVFDGANPQSSLTLAGNTLYGVVPNGGLGNYGAVFKVNTDGSGFTDLYSFSGPDGANPYGTPLLVGNTLYGTTSQGGSNSVGTIFSIKTDGTGFTNLHSLASATDGALPMGGLILAGNLLYGTAENGGSNSLGTIFAISTNGSGFKVLHAFANADGTHPQAPLVLGGATLYGEAYNGGSGSTGSIFKIDTNGSNFITLRVFSDITGLGTNGEGANPTGGLLLSGATLYGTTYSGGDNHSGNVFKIGTNGMGYSTLINFDRLSSTFFPQTNATGGNPESGLFLNGDTLYGTTFVGGSTGYGTLFQVKTNANAFTGFTHLYDFIGSSGGGFPYGGVVQSGGALLGTTYAWGANENDGIVFSFNLLPPLQIVSVSNSVVVSWQDDGQNHTLQTTTNLASGIWTNAPPLNMNENLVLGLQITNLHTAPAAYFRLKQ
jgi:uncharacterized repeat protein (TIGR03803 family)